MDTGIDRALRIIIADEQVLLREGIAQLLQGRGFDVVAQAADADELITKTTALAPDVAVTDVELPPDRSTDGLRAVQAIRCALPDVAVLLFADSPTPAGALGVIDGDARGVGYLQRTRSGDTVVLTDALRRVAAGEAAIDSAVAEAVLGRAASSGRIKRLSPRERAVVLLMLEGKADPEIGQALRISGPAVERHIARVYAALGLESEPDPGLRTGALMSFLVEDRRRDLADSISAGVAVGLDDEEPGRPRALVTGFERAQS